MSNTIKKSLWLMVIFAIAFTLSLGLSANVFAADNAPVIDFELSGDQVAQGIQADKPVYFVLADKEANTATAALTKDGAPIKDGVAWSIGSTNQASATIDPASGVLSMPKWEGTSKAYVQLRATYEEKTSEYWIYVLNPNSITASNPNGWVVDGENTYSYTLDKDGKQSSYTPYICFGDFANYRLVDFSFSEEGFASAAFTGGQAINISPLKPGTVDFTVFIKNHPEFKCTITLNVKGVAVADANGTVGTTSTYVGEKISLEAMDDAGSDTFTWSTTNKTVATVKNGVVTARKPGYAMVYATNGNKDVGGIKVYVYENDKKPYLDNLTLTNGSNRKAGENGTWLNEKDTDANSTSREFSRTRWDYGIYTTYSSSFYFRTTPTFDENKYKLDYYVNGEKKDTISSGKELSIAITSGETDVAFRLYAKNDENLYTEYHVHIWEDYSSSGNFTALKVAPTDRIASSATTFTLENSQRTGTYYNEGFAYNVNASGQITTSLVSNSYMPWGRPTRVMNAYLFDDVDSFSMVTYGNSKHIAYSVGTPWTKAADEATLPEGWQLYDQDNMPSFTFKADEDQEYMTIYLRSVCDSDFENEGWMADPAVDTASASNVSDRELHVYKLPFKADDLDISDLTLSQGSFMTPAFSAGTTSASAVINSDCESVDIGIKITDSAKLYKTVTISDANLLTPDENGAYTFNVKTPNTSTSQGFAAVLSVPKNDTFTYSLKKNCVVKLSKRGDMQGLPNKVVDYIAPGSQYTNGRQTQFTGGKMYAQYPERTLLGSSDWQDVTSLGAFGGYITWYYEDAITDDPSHAYGVDFQVFGNSYASGDGGYGAGETGQVWVSEDGKNWYALAGSEHFEDSTLWDYQLTYKNNNTSTGYDWSDNLGNSGTLFNDAVGAEYPDPAKYPLFNFGENKDEVTLGGVYMPSYVHRAMFGYVDALSSSSGYSGGGSGSGSDLENEMENPYASTGKASCFDLAWAVDKDGNPVTFENGIHYVKVQTAVYNTKTGIMGELSTEVSTCLKSKSRTEDLGKTDALETITISNGEDDTNAVTLKAADFSKVSDTVYRADVSVGALRNLHFTVDAKDDHIYVNNQSLKSGEMTKTAYTVTAEKGRVVRVIVQSGTAEPISYFLNITGSSIVSENITAVENAIKAIGTVGQGSGEAIRAARAAYNALSEEEQASVSNYKTLVAAEKAYEELINAALGTSDELITVTMSVEKFTLGQGYILEPTLVTIPKDTTAAQLAIAMLGNDNMKFDGTGTSSFYLSSIADKAEAVKIPDAIQKLANLNLTNERASEDWLSEFDYAAQAGWMYSVAGEFPQVQASGKTMNDGEAIRWQFTVAGLGADIGDTNSGKVLIANEKDALTTLVAKVNALENSEGFIKDNAEAYEEAMAVLKNWSADKAAIDTAYAKLEAALNAATEDKTYGNIVPKNLVEDKAIAKAIKLIDAIPGDITAEAKDAIEAARAAYDSLSADLQKYVTNYDKLTAAEEAYNKLTMKLPFTDVTEKDWFYGAVRYAYTNNLFKGVSETTFEPNSAMTRGMLAVVLYRIEGEPEVEGTVAFTDVPADQYYYNAVLWANQKGIVNGTSETTFAPNDKITREQLATMMIRYAKFKGENVDKVADLGIYKDNAQISDWAREGLRWANATGLITGRTVNTIDPQGNATRAEVATVLMRFLEK